MIDISDRITLLRKEKGWSQAELSKIVGCSREIISKYEKDSVTPSIDIAKKIADSFGVSLDYLVGENVNSNLDKKTVQRIQEIDNMDDDFKESVFKILDSIIRDYKTQKALDSLKN